MAVAKLKANNLSIMAVNDNRHQETIFSLSAKYPHFAELSNALYERELQVLANSAINDPILLKRKLKGLSHHIKNATMHLLDGTAPISVDVHNGSWQSKQSSKCPLSSQTSERTLQWYTKTAKLGNIVPIYVESLGAVHIELDCIDIMQSDRLHLNKFAWFSKSGEYFEIVPKQAKYLLLKPTKSIFSAACAGHTWNVRGKSIPRALSLRELLLSTEIDWKNYK
jgi:hypothetical protein